MRKRKSRSFTMNAGVLVTATLIVSALSHVSFASAPFNDLPDGWTYDVLFENVCVSPIGIAVGVDDAYAVDRCGNRIIRIDADGQVSKWSSTGEVALDNVAYQPNLGRLIGVGPNEGDGSSSLYEIDETGATLIGAFSDGGPVTAILVDPRDDGIYGVSYPGEAVPIRLFEADGTFVRNVVPSVHNVYNLALDPERGTLYYTEAGTEDGGRVTAYHLQTDTTDVIATGVGTGAPDDNVGVAVDGDGVVYYAALGYGLYRWDPRAPEQDGEYVMDILLGVGSIRWFEAGSALLQANVFLGAIVWMDPEEGVPRALEPVVNSSLLVGRADGTVFFWTLNQLHRLENGVLTDIGPSHDEPVSTTALLLDDQETLYLARDNALWTLDTSDGSMEERVNLSDPVVLADYDFVAHEAVVVTRPGPAPGDPMDGDATVWRTSLSPGATPRRVATLKSPGEIIMMTVSRDDGAVYFWTIAGNDISRLNETTGELEVLYEDVMEDTHQEWGINVASGFEYFSPWHGIIITYFEGLDLWPVDGSGARRVATTGCGFDNSDGYEDANGRYVMSHSSQIFRIRKDDGSCYVPRPFVRNIAVR